MFEIIVVTENNQYTMYSGNDREKAGKVLIHWQSQKHFRNESILNVEFVDRPGEMFAGLY